MANYIDKLKTRNKVEYENEKYFAYSYDDFFLGEWVGNINIFDKKTGKAVFHATTSKAVTYDELKEQVDGFDEFRKMIMR